MKKEQKTLRRKIAEKVVADMEVLDCKPKDLDMIGKIVRQDALSTADAIIKQVKRDMNKKFYAEFGA